MDGEKRGRGAPRRGPLADKTASVATKVRPDTLERLHATAKAKNMSVSQRIETLVLRGLDEEEDIGRYFTPAWLAFEVQMRATMKELAGGADRTAWASTAHVHLNRLAEDLRRAIGKIAKAEKGDEIEAAKSGQVVAVSGATPSGPTKRIIEI